MKSEDISKAIGELDEKTVEDAAQHRKARSKRPIWITVAAAAACLAVVGGIFAANFGKDSPLSVTAKAAVVAAEYPEMPQYPDEANYAADDRWEEYDKAQSAWRESRREMQNALAEDAADNLTDYFKKSAKEFVSGSENSAFSPLSLYMALCMLAETTDGSSRAQILELMNSDSIESLREQAQQVWKSSYVDDGATTSLLANSMWLSDSINYKRPTLENIAEYHYASSFSGEMGSAEYTELLQKWLDEQTGGLLTEQANNIELQPETVLALASTVYFKVRWQDEFNKNLTAPGTFHAPSGDVQTDFMHQTNRRALYFGDGFMMTKQSFANDEGGMYFILPDEGTTVDELLESGEFIDMLDNDWQNIAAINGRAKSAEVNLSVPKFDAVSELELMEGLQNLGITEVMSDRADFSPLCENSDGITLGGATHAARVKIDEEGCEAAAFTVMVLCSETGSNDEPIDFTLDRPFIYVITNSADLPMFVGVVNNPVG